MRLFYIEWNMHVHVINEDGIYYKQVVVAVISVIYYHMYYSIAHEDSGKDVSTWMYVHVSVLYRCAIS